MEKILNQGSFKYLVWTPLGSRVNILIHFFFKFTLRCKPSDIVPIIFHRCHWNQWQINCGCHWNQGQFVTGVNDTTYRWQIYSRCCWYWRWSWTCFYLREFFCEKNENTPMLLLEAWGKMLHKKKPEAKISWQCPFKMQLLFTSYIWGSN